MFAAHGVTARAVVISLRALGTEAVSASRAFAFHHVQLLSPRWTVERPARAPLPARPAATGFHMARVSCQGLEPSVRAIIVLRSTLQRMRRLRVESRTGAVAVVSRWQFGWAFAWPPQSGLAWLCFLFPLIEPDRRSYRIRLSEKTHGFAHGRLVARLGKQAKPNTS